MSRLEYLARPLVAFNPSDKDHRRYYAEFLEYGGWGSCPVRFICPEDFGMDLPSMIKHSLIRYYVDREFGGGKLAKERSQALKQDADKLYKEAGQLRKEAQSLLKPRRS
jgi:hypothetical protein